MTNFLLIVFVIKRRGYIMPAVAFFTAPLALAVGDDDDSLLVESQVNICGMEIGVDSLGLQEVKKEPRLQSGTLF